MNKGDNSGSPAISGTLRSGEKQSFVIKVDRAEKMDVFVSWFDMSDSHTGDDGEAGWVLPSTGFVLYTPAGEQVSESKPYRNGSYLSGMGGGSFAPPAYQYTVDHPEPGEWKVEIDPGDIPNGSIAFLGGVGFEGGVQISTEDIVGKVYPVAQEMRFTISISDTQPIEGARLRGKAGREKLSFAEIGNGLYEGIFVPAKEGFYIVDVVVAGTDNSGNSFERDFEVGISAAASGGMVGQQSDSSQPLVKQEQAYDDDGDGLFERLVLTVAVDIKERGAYQLRGNLNVAAASEVFRLQPGRHELPLTFYGTSIRARRKDGPYDLTLLVFERMHGEEPTLLGMAENVYTTKAYKVSDWPKVDKWDASTPVYGVFMPRHTGGYLELTIQVPEKVGVEVVEPLTVTARLAALTATDGGDPIIAYASVEEVKMGLSYATFRFRGKDIYSRGLDGPYIVDRLTVTDAQGKQVEVAPEPDAVMMTTPVYFYDEFEGDL